MLVVAQKPKSQQKNKSQNTNSNTEKGLEVKARVKDLVNRGKDQFAFVEKTGRSCPKNAEGNKCKSNLRKKNCGWVPNNIPEKLPAYVPPIFA